MSDMTEIVTEIEIKIEIEIKARKKTATRVIETG